MGPKTPLIDPSPLIELHRKIKHIKKVRHAHDLDSYAHGQGRSQVMSKSCLSNN